MRDSDAESAAPAADTPGGGELAVLPLRGGEHVGRYVILYRLGKGGMGVVYAAYDPQLDRKLAIKFMRPKGGAKARIGQQAMLHEAQALARLSHPNVVAIHDVGLVGDRVFVAMDFLDGVTLRRWVVQSKRPRDIVAAYVQAGEGLAAAHRAGIVHRDFKPDNAIVSEAGAPKREGAAPRVQVLDFGLARVHDPALGDASTGPGMRDGEPHDKPARPRGTPMYMAPEQHRGEDAGPPCDQFAFCVSLYEALWRRLPFPGDDNLAIGRAIVEGRVVDPPRGDVPTRVRKAILRGLSTDPRARFPNMDALLAELRKQGGKKRRIAAVAAGIAVIGTGAWAFGRLGGQGTDPCADAEQRIADVWNDARADEVERALVGTARAHAKHTAEGLRTRLDRYAAGWTTQWSSACAATHEQHEQSEELLDLRMACLDARRGQLEALVRLFAHADGEVADHALEAADALPAFDPCADATALRAREPLPDDPAVRAQIEELRARLAHAEALEHAGKPDDALAIAELASRRADEVGYAPLRAEAALRLGNVLEVLGRWQAAETALRRAEVAAEAARDDASLADARIALVMVSGDRLLRQREGELWAELARAALDRLGHDAPREALLENNVALALEHSGRPEEVLEHQRRALALAGEDGGMAELRRASLYINMATTLSDAGMFDEALARAEAGLAIWQTAYGDEHPSTATALGAIGMIHDHRGDHREALVWYERSYDTLVRVLGPDSPRSAAMLNNLAIAAIELGEVERGIAGLERVLAIHRVADGEDSADAAQAHQNLGSALRLVERFDEGLAHHRRALAVREQLFGRDDPRIARSLVGVANILEEDLGRAAEALELRRRAIALSERGYGRDSPELTLELANLAHNLMIVGELDEALLAAERGHRLSKDESVEPTTAAFAELVHARVLAEIGRDDARARALLEDCRGSLGEDVDGAGARLVAATEKALARRR